MDPAAELGAYFRVMRLGDDPSPREQQVVPVPAARAGIQMQLQAEAGHYYLPLPPNYVVGESSEGAGYVPPYASCSAGGFYNSHFGAHSPRLNAAPAPPSTPNKPVAGVAAPHPSESSHPSSTPSPSAAHFQLVPSAPHLASDSCSSLNPYASAFQSTLSANPVDYQPWIPTPARYYYPTLEQVRSRLHRRPMDPDLLRFPETAAHVDRLLREGDEQVRRSVLARVRSDVLSVTGTSERQAVFLALVRACAGRPDELQHIIQALYKGNGFLMGVAKHNYGLATVVKELARALVPHPQLLVLLICWLIRERLMEQCNGGELLQYCFTKMSYEDSKVIIQFATFIVDELLFSSFGSRCLAQCLVYARNGELRALENIILNRTVEIAMGQYSNYFLQRAIECGSELLQVAIADRVAADVASLSLDRFGSYVVEASFLLARTPVPLQRLLAAFMSLRGNELADLVRGSYSNYVVSKLLDDAKNHFPQEARLLARRIEGLPMAVQREMHARGVMRAVGKLNHRHLGSHRTLY
ncbi:uncharacterized protein LOC120689360 [Panicum virgatum]|nr:uncharacterized protein LOC120689360 [Panicum virgatum]